MPVKKQIHFTIKQALCIIIFVQVLTGAITGAEKNRTFTIGMMKVKPGTTQSGYLQVPRKNGIGTRIPVTVINGSRKGKVLALVAGIHAYEYPPILALYRLKNEINPAKLSGALIMVHIANLPGFQKRLIYYTPGDWKNLNRVFPGDINGTLAQRIARVITDQVVKKCDALIDLHCGDGNEALIPYCYWMLSDDASLNKMTKEMVLAFGIKHIIIDKSRTRDITSSKYLGNTAVLYNKPAITTESGYLGKTDEKFILQNIRGIKGVMRLFKMIPGEAEMVEEPVWIDRYRVIYSESSGLFYPETEMGYYVSKGEKIGYVTDYLGNFVRNYRAPFTGILLYIINTPPVVKGEPLFEVGSIKEN
jgi:predicted deacylase